MSDTGSLTDSAPTRCFWFESAINTHVGTVRQVNEDAHLDRPDVGLWAVADGMGGHDAGDYASRAVVEEVNRCIDPDINAITIDQAVAGLQACNRRLRQFTIENSLTLAGSTVVLLTISGRRYDCAWAGDSRLYLLRDGQLLRITRDHSYVQELVDGGQLDPAAAEGHPRANVVTRAVGADEELELDVVGGEVCDGDTFLLCSDGLTKAVPESTLAAALSAADGTAADTLLRTALDHGARDNVTLVVVRCQAVARRSAGAGAP
jgi:serine/threonine protein phosphatase PrpC